MKLIVFACSLILVQAVTNNDDVIISGVRYQKEVLYENLEKADSLSIDYSTNILYFRNDLNGLARFDLNTKVLRNIEGTRHNVCHLAVNQQTKDVFMGTTYGIYKYNPIANKIELMGPAGHTIWNVYLKGDLLYYNELNKSDVYLFTGGQSVKHLELDASSAITELFVDDEDTAYFVIGVDLYRQKKGEKAVLLYDVDKVFKTFITADRNGKVYFGSRYGLYEILKDYTVKKIFSGSIYGLTFEEDNNLIYADDNHIYRLKRVVEIGDLKKEITNLEKVIARMEIKMDNILEQLSQRSQCNPCTNTSQH